MFSTQFKMALTSLKRRKSRTFLVIIMIGVCLWGMLVMEGVYDGMTTQVINNSIRSSSGHISFYKHGYRLNRDIEDLVEPTQELLTFLNLNKHITGHSYRLEQDCLVATSHFSVNGKVIGIDLESEKNVGRLDEYIVKGEYFFGRKDRGIILGSKLAEKLKTDIGKKIILSAQNSSNDITSLAMRVTGILRSNTLSMDETSVFINIETAETLLQTEKFSQGRIFLSDPKYLEHVVTEAESLFPELEFMGWFDLFPALKQSESMMKLFNLITSIIVFCIAGLGIFGVMLVSVLERIREFGVMIAIGTSQFKIFIIILVESFLMSVSGFLFGTLLGTASLYYFMTQGLDLTIFSEGMDTFGLDSIIYAVIKPSYFINSALAISFASLISIFYPLWILKKSNPIESINKI